MITTWYLQSQRTWDKLCHSCIGSPFLPRGAFPEGRAYAFSQRWHAGSLEALRVSRPEAVVLVVNKSCVAKLIMWRRPEPPPDFPNGARLEHHITDRVTASEGSPSAPCPPSTACRLACSRPHNWLTLWPSSPDRPPH